MAKTDRGKSPSAAQPSEAPYLSAADRRAKGKALRDAVPRQSQAGWKPKKGRRDPVELLIESNAGRIENLIPIRHGRMDKSPFAFYRGSAALMAADPATTPTSGPRDMKMSAAIENWDMPALRRYARMCAQALARAHARSGDAAVISGYMSSGQAFDDAIGEFAVEYGDQARSDYRSFVQAIRDKRIQAIVEH